MKLSPRRFAIAVICLPTLAAAPAAQAADGYAAYAFRSANALSRWVDIWGNNQGNGYGGGGSAVTAWGGQGGHTASGPISPYTTNPVNVDFWSDPAGGHGGITYSGGEFSIPGPTAWPDVAQFNFHLYSVLGDNAGAYAATESMVAGNIYTEAASNPQMPLHYRIDWQMQAVGNAGLFANVMNGNGDRSFQLSPGSGSIVGVLGADFYPWGAGGAIVPFDLNTSASDHNELRDPGRVDLWATLYLSSSPISAVPEPGTWALLVVGLAALRLRHRSLGVTGGRPSP